MSTVTRIDTHIRAVASRIGKRFPASRFFRERRYPDAELYEMLEFYQPDVAERVRARVDAGESLHAALARTL